VKGVQAGQPIQRKARPQLLARHDRAQYGMHTRTPHVAIQKLHFIRSFHRPLNCLTHSTQSWCHSIISCPYWTTI